MMKLSWNVILKYLNAKHSSQLKKLEYPEALYTILCWNNLFLSQKNVLYKKENFLALKFV